MFYKYILTIIIGDHLVVQYRSRLKSASRCGVYDTAGEYVTSTYDHRVWKTGLPVRSAVLKPHAGELVVGWVTTSESSLLKLLSSV
ncbi:L-lysine 2-3-aminomutase [Penicillium fimorum]|uniref:L-lysine 2-3-aminomutase n=1 Tax=Penicillium fimorum TaxID=1882269 RepID=A0A9W9Y5J6_9EURO|nr:L-lysine 2-3-aminomutase [Penicillium fimorum]